MRGRSSKTRPWADLIDNSEGSATLLAVAPLRLLNRIIIRAHIAPLHELDFIQITP